MLNKVQSGDPLKIPAPTFNTFVDTANDFLARRHDQFQGSRPAARHSGIVLVRNDSGADRARFDVLGIDSPLFAPADAPDTFKNAVILAGVTPTATDHTGKFVVLLEPVASGAIARAVLAGVTAARVNVTDSGNQYADVEDGQCGELLGGLSGTAQILWKEEGTGVKWAVLRLGNPSQPSTFLALVTKDGGDAGNGDIFQGDLADCSYTYTVKTLDDQTILKKDANGNPAVNMVPERARYRNTEYWYAGEFRGRPNVNDYTSRYALVARTPDGTLLLLDCYGEIAKDQDCP